MSLHGIRYDRYGYRSYGACLHGTQPTEEVAVNYRPAAAKALVLIAATLVPGALFAGTASGVATAVDWDGQDSTITGITTTWSKELLRHNAGTLHKFVGNPDIIPPGACRAVARRWNIAVFMGRPGVYFATKLLPKLAQHNCRFQFERADLPNGDGSFDLKVIGPASD